MNPNPAISVVMPVLNGERHLHEAIESIRAQTFSNFELIIVNDGSTDGTASILGEYQTIDSRIRVITHPEKSGLAPALNSGLRIAKGRYIARMDHDDVALPDRFALQYQFLEQHPEMYLVGGGYAAFNERGHRLNIFHPSSSLEIAWSFLTNTRFCHPTVMFRRDLVESLGMYPETGAEDFAFFSKIVRQFRCTNVRTILIKYREHTMNYSHTAKTKILSSVKQTFNENFLHYIDDLRYAETFYRYHTENVLHVSDLTRIHRMNHKILRRARQQYKIPFWSRESISLALRLQLKNIRALAVTYIRQLIGKSSTL